jgi:hypothetical protein
VARVASVAIGIVLVAAACSSASAARFARQADAICARAKLSTAGLGGDAGSFRRRLAAARVATGELASLSAPPSLRPARLMLVHAMRAEIEAAPYYRVGLLTGDLQELRAAAHVERLARRRARIAADVLRLHVCGR